MFKYTVLLTAMVTFVAAAPGSTPDSPEQLKLGLQPSDYLHAPETDHWSREVRDLSGNAKSMQVFATSTRADTDVVSLYSSASSSRAQC